MLTLNSRILRALECALLLILLQPRPAPAQNGTSSPSYTGWLEHAGCDGLSGWAADRLRPDTPINVQIYDGPTLVRTVLANAPRPDVANLLGDNGAHGFYVPPPATVVNQLPHQLSIRFETSPAQLSGSPQSITCAGPPVALSANHYIAFQPLIGPATTDVFQYYRNNMGYELYGNAKMAIISKGAEVTVVNYVAHTYHTLENAALQTPNNPILLPAPPVVQNLIMNPMDLDAFSFQFANGTYPPLPPGEVGLPDTAPCSASGKGYSVVPPPPTGSGGQPLLAPPIEVKVWTCLAFSLPMYFDVIDPQVGSKKGWFDNFVLKNPPDYLFVIPTGFKDDPSLSGAVASTGSSCNTMVLPSPVLWFSNSYQAGQGSLTILTDPTYGCVVTNVSILVGPSMTARPISLLGGSAFHILFANNGGSNPVLPSGDVGLVTFTLSNGSSMRTLMIATMP
jgi:hypothetical protein